MPTSEIPSSDQGIDPSPGTLESRAPVNIVTLFAIPKAFDDPHTALIQRNAIASWCHLRPAVRVILMGNDSGVAELAHEFDCEHVAELKRNSQGTPLLDDAFAIADKMATSPLVAYINSDIILLSDFVISLSIVNTRRDDDFLLIGRRIDTDIATKFDFSDWQTESQLHEIAKVHGQMAPVVCKDYFVFPRGLFATIPEFAVGRGNWDNWMVAHAGVSSMTVIDATELVTAIHQNHDYEHVQGGQRAVYVTGGEARRNARLAGGSNLISGCRSHVRLVPNEHDFDELPVTQAPFWSDLRAFTKLIGKLFLKK